MPVRVKLKVDVKLATEACVSFAAAAILYYLSPPSPPALYPQAPEGGPPVACDGRPSTPCHHQFNGGSLPGLGRRRQPAQASPPAERKRDGRESTYRSETISGNGVDRLKRGPPTAAGATPSSVARRDKRGILSCPLSGQSQYVWLCCCLSPAQDDSPASDMVVVIVTDPPRGCLVAPSLRARGPRVPRHI